MKVTVCFGRTGLVVPCKDGPLRGGSRGSRPRTHARGQRRVRPASPDGGAAPGGQTPVRPGPAREPRRRMKVTVCFGRTGLVVPCKDGPLRGGSRGSRPRTHARGQRRVRPASPDGGAAPGGQTPVRPGPAREPRRRMKVTVCFGRTGLVVPCKDGPLRGGSRGSRPRTHARGQRRVRPASPDGGAAPGGQTPVRPGPAREPRRRMKVTVCFGRTGLVVPCKDGPLRVSELTTVSYTDLDVYKRQCLTPGRSPSVGGRRADTPLSPRALDHHKAEYADKELIRLPMPTVFIST
ncbi:hypothetical protein NN561_002802 [Cricetulus griseus]